VFAAKIASVGESHEEADRPCSLGSTSMMPLSSLTTGEDQSESRSPAADAFRARQYLGVAVNGDFHF
jgi:hypothetical protein